MAGGGPATRGGPSEAGVDLPAVAADEAWDEARDEATSRAACEVARRARAAPPRAGRTRVVALDGPSGAGKSTLARAVAAEMGAPVVHVEDLYPGWDGLAEGAARLVDWVLRPLAEGRAARWRRYDWKAARYEAAWHDVPPVDVLVVEGVGAGVAAGAGLLSLLVWVEAAPGVRRARALRRDGDLYRPHWERWARQEAAFFAADPVRGRADVVVDTDSAGTDG